jgi:hypothetical protein
VIFGLLLAGWRWSRTTDRVVGHQSRIETTSEDPKMPLSPTSTSVDRRAASDAGLTHLDPGRRAEILRDLLALLQHDADAAPAPNGTAANAPGGPTRFRTTNDIEAAARFMQERIRNDFVPMARGCYQDLLRRKPESEGDVVVGFEILGDESVGGVVNSAEVRNESTLRDPLLETCLRESFLAVYFDPPPGGGRATIRFPFHFAHGDVDGSHELHLRDRRGEGSASGR